MAGKERSRWMKATNGGDLHKEAQEERGEEIRWGESGPSDLDTRMVQIESEESQSEFTKKPNRRELQRKYDAITTSQSEV